MSRRYVCLQGHLWGYNDEEVLLAGKAMFCPTCGLRLHDENQAPSMPIPPQQLLMGMPTPFASHEIRRLTRSSAGGGAAPAIQANDIEAIPGYELLGILGRGGMGIVFRARQLSLKRQVALKMILSGRHARPSDRARFQREAEAVARLQHPNIVQIHEVGEQNGLPYFSLEFVNAGSLAQWLGGNPQPPRLSAQFVHDLGRAMHYAHKRGIVHRDLKPANILLQLDESRILANGRSADTAIFRDLTSYVPKITDFGLAKHIGGEEGLFRGGMVGTPSYMAPEQAYNNGGEIGPAADVYALGAILYEMLTGHPPFIATTIEETTQLVMTQEPVPPAQLQPKIPKDLETICLVCLQKNPAHRYVSADALADDLRRFLANEPILARRTHLPERVVKWAIRRPLFATVTIGGLTLLSLFWWIWWQRAVTYQAEREEIRLAWQQSEQQLTQAMQTIDQMAAAEPPTDDLPRQPSPALLRAKQFYERLAQNDGPPLRTALMHFRLGKIQERLGDHEAAHASYQEAITRWEKLCQEWPDRSEFRNQLQEGRQRLQLLASRPAP